MSASDGTFSISGPGASELLLGKDSTLLSIILGYRPAGGDSISASPEHRTPDKLVELVRFLRTGGIEFELSQSAMTLLKGRRAYLEAFQNANARGRAIVNARNVKLALPTEFVRKLKPYQKRGLQHIMEVPYAANFSVPGSGKTTVVLGAYSALKAEGIVDKLFVVGPRSAFAPWEDEYEGCFNRAPTSARLLGTPHDRRYFLRNSANYELFLSTYQMLANELEGIKTLFEKHSFLFVMDESHHIKKGHEGVWFRAAHALAPCAKRRVILSGTPAPNTLDDLRPQLELLWPNIKEVEGLFSGGEDQVSLQRMRDVLRPLYVRVRKSDLRLPPRHVRRVRVSQGPVQGRIYDALARKVLEEITEDAETQRFLRELRRALVVRLLQASTNPSLLHEYSAEFRIPPLEHLNVEVDSLIRKYTSYEVPPKVAKAVDLAVDLAKRNQKSIVWTSFIHNVKTVKRVLDDADISSVAVTGSPTMDDTDDGNEQEQATREELLRRFREEKNVKVLVATIPSIGESVSLHKECHHAIYLDRTFNCGQYMQSMDRIHRVGLGASDKTNYYLLETRGTIDEVIGQRLDAKMERMHQLLDDDIGILDMEARNEELEGDFNEEDSLAVWTQLTSRRA